MRNFDLLTEIGFIVTSWLIAIGLGPVGIVLLFPLKGEQRQLLSGISLVIMDIIGFVLIGIILLFG